MFTKRKAMQSMTRRAMTIGDRVRKLSGYEWPGVIVADFFTLDCKRRLVVECTAQGVRGALHIYAPEQLELES